MIDCPDVSEGTLTWDHTNEALQIGRQVGVSKKCLPNRTHPNYMKKISYGSVLNKFRSVKNKIKWMNAFNRLDMGMENKIHGYSTRPNYTKSMNIL